MTPAIFLDRDGVLIEDVHLLSRPDEVRLLPGTPGALDRLRRAGYDLVVVTNQTVVARGMVSEAQVREVNDHLNALIVKGGGPAVSAYYVCPHHPNATVPAYRMRCDCRKPAPGLLLTAARERSLSLASSFMIGDRPSDVLAGHRAGCRTVLLQTGRHVDPPIEGGFEPGLAIQPDHACRDLATAADWILSLP